MLVKKLLKRRKTANTFKAVSPPQIDTPRTRSRHLTDVRASNFTFRMSGDMRDRVSTTIETSGQSMSEFVRDAVEHQLT